MKVQTTEIASSSIPSDNPVHQRLLFAYEAAAEIVGGDLLEIGCGTGRGIHVLMPRAASFTGIDKIEPLINDLKKMHPGADLRAGMVPPLKGFPDNSFDTIVSFQVIEHIRNDRLFLQEIFRVLRPGGKAIITTPNRKMSLSRNPYHIREYTIGSLGKLMREIFPGVDIKGVFGDEWMMRYHEENRKSVNRMMRFDVFNLQYLLPAFLLKPPYELLNRLNRNKLRESYSDLVMRISTRNFSLAQASDNCLDLFCTAWK